MDVNAAGDPGINMVRGVRINAAFRREKSLRLCFGPDRTAGGYESRLFLFQLNPGGFFYRTVLSAYQVDWTSSLYF
jgi:hypothetical protein